MYDSCGSSATFFVISYVRQTGGISFILHKLSLGKGQEMQNKNIERAHVFIAHFKTNELGFLIEKKLFVYQV